jgi:hypothetical protein
MRTTFLLAMLLVACGGASKPADSPSGTDTTASGASPESSAAPSDSSSPAASASAAPGDSSSAAAPAASSAAPAAATPPPAPGFGASDCGKCVNTQCDKPLAACNGDSTCTAQPPHLQSCTGAAKDCVGNAMDVSSLTDKPKKLYGAYVKCLTKALASKACKAQCSQ